ncbi:MAG: hypothetical protein C0490_15690, partial [Marivirga sp.]|nr:hypothetical protein [Marivirga sp.]
AEHYLRRALRLNPNDPDSLIQISSCFVFLGYVKEAEKLYNKVVQLNPVNQQQYNYMGAFIAFELGEFEKCISLGSKSYAPWVDFHAIMAAAHFGNGDHENMNRCWQDFLNEFQKKILKGEEYDPQEALQWVINVSPYKEKSNYEPFWKFISGKPVSILSRVISKEVPETFNEFYKANDLWQMSFEGKTIHMTEVKGFYDIGKLLDNPENQYHCSDLFGSVVLMGSEKLFDEKAKRSYQKRILELQEEIRWSENNNDLQRTKTLQQEYDDIVDHLSTSLGIRGKVRAAGDPIEKARSAVTWRIRTAIQKIEKTHPELGKHLTLSIKTGLFCSYSPERPQKWNSPTT